MILRHLLIFLITVYSLSDVAIAYPATSNNTKSALIIADPEKAFIAKRTQDADELMTPLPGEGPNEILENMAIIRIKGDFNNDGAPDEILALSTDFGNAGGNVELYLGNAHGEFQDMGSLSMNPGFIFKVIPLRKGTAKIIILNRRAPEKYNYYGYIISRLSVKHIPAKELPDDLNANDRNSFAGYCEQHSTACAACLWKDWKRTGKCEWH